MQQATYEWLCLLHKRHGPREFGKLVQKMLAIAYRIAGYGNVTERGVQGVDIDAADGDLKYSTEVKTTLGGEVAFQVKDAEGLAARKKDGYLSVLGVLRLSPLSDWLLVDAQLIRPGRLTLDSLRPQRFRELEKQLGPHFDTAITEHSEGALVCAQFYLDTVLRRIGVLHDESNVKRVS